MASGEQRVASGVERSGLGFWGAFAQKLGRKACPLRSTATMKSDATIGVFCGISLAMRRSAFKPPECPGRP